MQKDSSTILTKKQQHFSITAEKGWRWPTICSSRTTHTFLWTRESAHLLITSETEGEPSKQKGIWFVIIILVQDISHYTERHRHTPHAGSNTNGWAIAKSWAWSSECWRAWPVALTPCRSGVPHGPRAGTLWKPQAAPESRCTDQDRQKVAQQERSWSSLVLKSGQTTKMEQLPEDLGSRWLC